ncbi:MAG: diacylglycerol kinase family protein [Lactobacillaceae bacterium]|jgi:undecaprenol kinase|nr:diacylglycerol kinase family protein [Lactobacillaceae bacterium]
MDSQDKKIKKPTAYKRNKTFFSAVINAFNGFLTMLLRERNFRIHIVIALIIFLVGLYFDLSRSDWLWITIGVAFAVLSEILNTIIEAVVDLIVGAQYNDLAKVAKDVASAGVVFAVIVEFIIFALIFQPYIWNYYGLNQVITH